jgi:hypothetical protein
MAFMLALDSCPGRKDSAATDSLSLWRGVDFTENWELRTGNFFCYTCPVRSKEPFVMAGKNPQTFANHSRLDPLFHFFVLPVFVISTIAAIVLFLMHPSVHSGWHFLLITAATVAIFKIRLYANKLQDRVIRLEERLRLASLLQEPLRSRIPELTEDQLIGLRFASDAEVPKLTERALSEKLSRADIKKAVQTWRPDYWRV